MARRPANGQREQTAAEPLRGCTATSILLLSALKWACSMCGSECARPVFGKGAQIATGLCRLCRPIPVMARRFPSFGWFVVVATFPPSDSLAARSELPDFKHISAPQISPAGLNFRRVSLHDR
jgi:hypothetical protein